MTHLLNANALHKKPWYNLCCRGQLNSRAFCFFCRTNLQLDIVGKAPSVYLDSRLVLLTSTAAEIHGGRFVVRDKKGRFVDGDNEGINTRFQPGEHWRPRKLYWDRAWLYNEYVIKQRTISEIASDFGITANAIHHWVCKHDIPTRNISETRKIKHWGAVGKNNPMFGRCGEDNPNWKGGITPERQDLYSSSDWRRAVKKVWKRDKGICQRCGKRAGKRKESNFHIHHIVSFANKDLRTEVSNLILLCKDCHNWVHSLQNKNSEFIREND
jgi:hypothetical protein